jgi:anti-sigma factor RsiW
MACTKWEELGLLFSSGELSEQEQNLYSAHLAQCESCSSELNRYNKERETLFTPHLLSESPAASLDERILDACARFKKPSISFTLFPLFMRKSVAALLFLSLGLGGGIYIASNLNSAQRTNALAQHPAPVQPAEQVQTVALPTTEDSTKAGNDSVRISKPFGNSPYGVADRNVVPVDLNE